ncbi:MAG: nitronate monooxygenase [Alphaproteobacteria bacterium]|nr:nitronate monooxygenase [Alphaproteobacteria bacterium]
MPLPPALEGRLAIPAVAAPMFLVSGPDLVVEACRAGVLGTFPALNQRSSEGYAAWLTEIESRLQALPRHAPYGVNLIVHNTNQRLAADLDLTVKHKVPVVITSLGAVRGLVDRVHGYGGLVFHDVINLRHARKAAEAGVDGLILVCAGAGGHAGTLSPLAFIPEVRRLFSGTILLSGCISSGDQIAASLALGADLAYLGTRFIATRESLAEDGFKTMICQSQAADIVYTDFVSGVHGSFLRPSIAAAGLDPDNLPSKKDIDFGKELDPEHRKKKAWKNIWSAGQGVGSIDDVPSTAALCARLKAEYAAALDRLAARRTALA